MFQPQVKPVIKKKRSVYLLDVPKVAQAKSMSCWHASATMLWRYSQMKTGRQGPMHTLLDVYKDNTGIYPTDFIQLAKNIGLISVHDLSMSCPVTYSSELLISLLQQHGLIWCAGYWYGPGHIMVLTGVSYTSSSATVHFNDPDRGVAKSGSIDWLNKKLASKYSGCLMAKNPVAY